MPKEPATYRLELERLNERYPEKETFTFRESANCIGKTEKTAQKLLRKYYRKGVGISKVSIAYFLAGGADK